MSSWCDELKLSNNLKKTKTLKVVRQAREIWAQQDDLDYFTALT